MALMPLVALAVAGPVHRPVELPSQQVARRAGKWAAGLSERWTARRGAGAEVEVPG